MMTPKRYERLDQLFAATCDLGPLERAELLDRECADDPSLRSDVDWLLANDADPSSFMESPALGVDFHLGRGPTPAEPDGSLVGQRISQYRLTRVIAAGGMGTVYEAVQDKPKRTVAVKVMRRGIASRSALRRFEYEAQILARLRHPGIAQVFEAGSSGDEPEGGGVPYFVMEYVANAQPITEHAKTQGLTTRQRLELFAKVCDAVQHGHQRGIIHRDLKPGNILVDSSGEPKIIDFGVARATDSDMAVTTMQTDVGQLLGTLQYMSPEQCAANPHDLDTRTDVYSLGVVLYELLCEQLPYDVTHAGVPEAVRVVREEVPPRPSSINYALRGDVETIVLKALEKDRSRRYQTASAFAEDVQRYLTNQPILARAPSAMYQLKKLVARHKVPFGFITAMFVLTVGASIWMSVLYQQAGAERDRALDAEELAEARLAQTEQARDEAESVTGFLADMLAAADPWNKGMDVKVVEVLDQVGGTIAQQFKARPLVEARLRATIGQTYQALSEYESAETHLQRALEIRREQLGEDDLLTLHSLNDLVGLYAEQGDCTNEPLFVEALETHERVLGEEDAHTLTAMKNLRSLYRQTGRREGRKPLGKRAQKIRESFLSEDHEDNPDRLSAMLALGEFFLQGRVLQAEPLLVQALEGCRRVYGADHPQTLRVMSDLARVYRKGRRFADAESLLEQVLQIRERDLGPDHPATLGSMRNLAATYAAQDRDEDAEALYLQVLETTKAVLGEDHLTTAGAMKSLGELYAKWRRYEDAEALFDMYLDTQKRVLGEDNPQRILSLKTMAFRYRNWGRYEKAEPIFLELVDGYKRNRGEDDNKVLLGQSFLADIYRRWQRYEKSEAQYLQLVETRRRVNGEEDPATLGVMKDLARLYVDWLHYDQAEQLFRQVLEINQRVRGDEHRDTLGDMNNIGYLYLKAESYQQAQPHLVQTLQKMRRALGEEDQFTLICMTNLGDLYTRLDRHAEAEPLLAEAVSVARQEMRKGHWLTRKSLRLHGVCLTGMQRYDEAEDALLEAVQGDERSSYGLTVDALADLYDAWDAAEPGKGHAEKAAEWRAKLPDTDPDSRSRSLPSRL